MKRIVCLLIIFITFCSCTFATEIQTGGVSYDVNSAREYIQQGQVNNVNVSGPFQLEENNIAKTVYSYNNAGEVIGITVQYINDAKRAYIYDKNKKLIYMEKYDKPISVYPHRGYRYNLEGKLDLTSLSVSKNEHYRFSPDGTLIAHSINGIIYDENGNTIGRAK